MTFKAKHILTALASTLLLFSCNIASSQSSSADTPSTDTTQTDSATSTATSTSDNSSSNPGVIGDENWIYYAEDLRIQLNLDYAGHSFWTDGIEEVELYSTIDGDTAHFTTSTGKTLKSRFYGIDTPESTGQVQPYGKKASEFTAAKLNAAKENGTIVVSSAQDDYGEPNADSTGSRYVSLIWINENVKHAPFNQLQLLNLMVVEYGFSWVKSVNSMPQYSQTFYDAENQAKAYKLQLFSGLPDDKFNYGDYEDVSLLAIKEEVVACLADDTRKNAYDNAKVRVQGTVAGEANNIIYIEDFCFYYRQVTNENGDPLYYQDGIETTEETDEDGNPNTPVIEAYNKKTGEPNPDEIMIEGETGEYAGMNIFKGMSTIPSKFTTVGNFIQVCGVALDSQFGFQITSASFKTLSYDDNDAKVLLTAAENTEEHALRTFEYTAEELSAICAANNYVALNCRVSITSEAEVTSYFDAESGAIYLYFSAYRWSVYLNFNYKPYPDNKSITWTSGENFVNHKFLFSGVLAIHQTTSGKNLLYMYPCNSGDIVLQDA